MGLHQIAVDFIKAKLFGGKIVSDSIVSYKTRYELADLADDDHITKYILDSTFSGGSITIKIPVITAGTPIPFFVDVSLYDGILNTADVITKTQREDPVTGDPTGLLQRWYDMDVVDQDTNNDGTGTFTGWNVYGHDDGSGNFKYDTIVILKQ